MQGPPPPPTPPHRSPSPATSLACPSRGRSWPLPSTLAQSEGIVARLAPRPSSSPRPSAPHFAVSPRLPPPTLSSSATHPPSSPCSAVFYPIPAGRQAPGSPPPRPGTPNTRLTDFAISAAAAVAATACRAQTAALLAPPCALGRADGARLRGTQTTTRLHTQTLGSKLRCLGAALEPPGSPRAAAAGAQLALGRGRCAALL